MRAQPSDLPIRFEDVTVSAGAVTVLDRVSLAIQSGAPTVLIGPNGSGKTTFLNVLSGAYRAQSGSVKLDDIELIGSKPSTIARAGLSRTFQNIRLYKSLTVLENVMVGAACHSALDPFAVMARTARQRGEETRLRDEALQALQLVGLATFAARPAGSLAYAQQRLLEIARAVAARPKLLLLDEPAAGLNRGETTALAKLIRAIATLGVTVLLIEHDMSFVMSIADRVAVLDFGKLIAQGTPAEVQKNKDVLAAYLGTMEAADA
jgi:branched-chain amino acid transport system ATP-binding protein